MKKQFQIGMTLLELTVVLLILIALAGLAMPYLGGTGRAALCKATDATMQNIKKAIMGGGKGVGYYQDTLGNFPVDKGNTDYSLHYLFVKGDGAAPEWGDYDPDTEIGWRGPYLQTGIVLGGSGEFQDSNLDNSFTNISSPFDPDNDHVHLKILDGTSAVLDGWGRPIVLQVHSNYGGRLVSAGPGSGLGFVHGSLETVVSGGRAGDDRILYLNAATPAADVNDSCD